MPMIRHLDHLVPSTADRDACVDAIEPTGER